MMPLAIDALIVCVIIFAIITGSRRGAVMLGLEFISFSIATLIAILLYHPLGTVVLKLGVTLAIANLAAFSFLLIASELLLALVIRYVVFIKLAYKITKLTLVNRVGGAVLGVIKYAFIMMFILVVLTGLPISKSIKQPFTSAVLGQALLNVGSRLQAIIFSGIGKDLGSSLNFFTVSPEIGSKERIDLGYSTTDVKVAAADEEGMLKLINRERASQGLSALEINAQARIVARSYSKKMFAEGYFAHIDPQNQTPFDRLRTAGVDFSAAGENLALAPTLDLAHQGLMNSPGHRANILSTNFNKVGIGIIDGGPYGLMVTQVFTN